MKSPPASPHSLIRGAGSQNVIFAAIASNVAIAVCKFAAAALTGSSAMMAEGFHSLVDTGNELLLWFGLKRSRKVADEWHPFGYGKAGYFWAFIVALSVFLLGGGISVYQGIANISSPPQLEDPTWNYFVLVFAAIFEGLSWRVSQLELQRRKHPGENLWQTARRCKDSSLLSVFIEDSAALIGIALAALGIGLSHAFDNPYFDPAASVLIGLVLVAAAFLLAKECAGLLVGQSLDRNQIRLVRQLIADDAAVERVGQILSMRLGTDNVLLTVVVHFHPLLSFAALGQAIARLEYSIQLHFPSVRHLYLDSGSLKSLAHRVPETT